jgi:hypothetical protein
MSTGGLERASGKNIKFLPELAAEQELNGGWEFAKLSAPKPPAAAAVNKFWRSPSGRSLGLGRHFGPVFGLGSHLLPLQIRVPPFSFLCFVVLLAHNDLYITNSLRLFSAL